MSMTLPAPIAACAPLADRIDACDATSCAVRIARHARGLGPGDDDDDDDDETPIGDPPDDDGDDWDDDEDDDDDDEEEPLQAR